MTSSAMASSPGGISMPSALAVFRLITSSNLVGCVTGRSAGFSPLRIRGTYCRVLQTRPAVRLAGTLSAIRGQGCGHGLQIRRHQLIGVEPCQLAQFFACAVKEAALRAF